MAEVFGGVDYDRIRKVLREELTSGDPTIEKILAKILREELKDSARWPPSNVGVSLDKELSIYFGAAAKYKPWWSRGNVTEKDTKLIIRGPGISDFALYETAKYGVLLIYGFKWGGTPQAGLNESIGFATWDGRPFITLNLMDTFNFVTGGYRPDGVHDVNRQIITAEFDPDWAATGHDWMIRWLPHRVDVFVDNVLKWTSRLYIPREAREIYFFNYDTIESEMWFGSLEYRPLDVSILRDDEKVMDLEIRDTAAHNSSVSVTDLFPYKTVAVKNTLDQSVSVQVQGDRSYAFGDPVNIGVPFTVASGERGYGFVDSHWNYLRAVVTALATPTTGKAEVWVEKLKV